MGCKSSCAPDHPSLHVKRELGVPKERECFRINGVSPNIIIAPFNNDIDTLERAVKERVFFVKNLDKKSPQQFVPPPRPLDGKFASTLAQSVDLLASFLPKTAPLTHQQFVDTVRGRKKKAYQQALELIGSEGLNLEGDSSVKVFVKYEKTDRTTKCDPVPRVISPRNPKFNIALGRYLRPMEERIFKALGKLFGHPTVMKGMDTDRTARVLREKWEKFNKPVAIGLDASRFDQHVSLDALKLEHSIYTRCLRFKKHVRKLERILKCQLVNRCRGYTADGKLSYTIEGTRMSGDMNTSLGNCVLMCLMIHQYALDRGVKVQLANNGDDCVVFLEQRDLEKFSQGLFEWFLQMGFNMAIEEPAYEFEHIEFCQTRPVFDGVCWTMCRNPLSAIAKDSVFLKGKDYEKLIPLWLDAVGTGGLALAGGLPIFNSFYSMLRRSGNHVHKNAKNKLVSLDNDEILPWYMRETSMSGKRVANAPSPEARSSFYSAWGITPDEQVSLERYYDTLLIVKNVANIEWAARPIFTEV